MKNLCNLRFWSIILLTTLFMACSSGRYKGSASDTTGTNGATNGTGKVAPLN